MVTKKYTFEQVLADPVGRKLIETMESMERYTLNPIENKWKKNTQKELKRIFGFDYKY